MYDSYEVKTGNTATHLAHGYVTITTTAHFKIIYYNTINLYKCLHKYMARFPIYNLPCC